MKKYLVIILMFSVVMLVACKPAVSSKVSSQVESSAGAPVPSEEGVTPDLQEIDQLDTQLDDLNQVDLNQLEKMDLE